MSLQHSFSKLRRVLNFKDDLSDLLRTMEEAEGTLAKEDGDTDGLLSNHRNKNNGSTSISSGVGKKTKKKRSSRVESKAVILSDGEGEANLGGKEFYL